jgi:HK97 family phage major capsid protein
MSDKQKELKGLLKETLDGVLDEKLAAFEERQAKKIEDMDSETKARLDAIEAMPARKVSVKVPGSPRTVELYKGYDLNKQGMRLQIADEDKKERIAKWFIDCLQGKAAMQEGTGSEGGYLVPDEYADVILGFARNVSYALQKATIFPMGTDVLRVPAEDGAVSVAITAEESAATQSEPTVVEVVLTAKRIDAYSIMSNELLQDSAFDIVSWLTELFAEKIGEKIDAECIYGTSLGTGIETASGINQVALDYGEGVANMTYTDLSNVVNQLTGNKLPGAEWVAPKAFTHYARLLQDGAGSYAWGSMRASDPPGIFGYPVAVVDQFPTDTGDNILAVFGNWKYMLLGQRKSDMVLDLDPYGLFTSYQTRTRMITRWAMAVGLAGGLVRLMSGNPTTTTT